MADQRPSRPGQLLLSLAAAATLIVGVVHAVAARDHFADAAHARAVAAGQLPAPPPKAPPPGLDYTGNAGISNPAVQAMHVEHARDEQGIARMLAGSAAVGLALAVAGLGVIRRRRGQAVWAAAVIVSQAAFLAAGVASRSSLGLLGHVDNFGRLWAATLAVELAAVALAAAGWAATSASRFGVIVGHAVGRARVPG